MKKTILKMLIMAVVLFCLLLGCANKGQTKVQETKTPEVTTKPEITEVVNEPAVAENERIEIELEKEYSLENSSGEKFNVSLNKVKNDEAYPEYEFVLHAGNDDEDLDDYDRFVEGYLYKIEGEWYAMLTFDWASDDYTTEILHLTKNDVEDVTKLNATIAEDSVIDENFVMEFRIYVLGTYAARKNYTLEDPNRFTTTDEWFILSGNLEERTVIVNTRELNVIVDGKQTVLPVGSKVCVIKTDDESKVILYNTDTKQEMLLEIQRNAEGMVTIDGEYDFELFENLPYAG